MSDEIFNFYNQVASSSLLRTSLQRFVERPAAYKKAFLQDKFSQGLDGYSYWGQTNSNNQYSTDMLHSFVLSEFTKPALFPKEFHDFFSTQWDYLKNQVRQRELEIIRQLNIEGLEALYEQVMGHMISCNYYPATQGAKETGSNNTRLSKHKDISLLTTFLFGIDDGLSYQDKQGKQCHLGTQKNQLAFSGYLLELLSDHKIKALEHQVELPLSSTCERYSFAFFSVIQPNSQLIFNGLNMSAEQYHKKYLSLF